jgi:signal transduction histidine kinase
MVMTLSDKGQFRGRRPRRSAATICAWLTCFYAIAGTAACQEPRCVVVLYPEGDGRPGNILVDRGVRHALQAYTAGPVEIYNEYLDLTRFPDERSRQRIAEFLAQKYADRRVDVVIPGLAHALDFLLKYRPRMFPGVPIVFCAVEQGEIEARTLPSDVVGVPMRFDLESTLDLALRLHPDTQHVYVVAGAAPYDIAWEARAREAFRRYEAQHEFTYLSRLPLEELLERVAHLPQRSIVYYVHVFQDGAGKILIPAEVLENLASVANAPIFGHVDTFVGRGIVGGRPMSFEANGLNAGQLALRILNGESLEAIGISSPGENAYQFDWRQLRRWGIDERKLPAGSAVLFQQPTFWDLYKWHVIGVLSLCVVEAFLIIGLLAERMQRRGAEEQLRASYVRQKDLAGQLLNAQEGERRRIARELHDDLNQGLALLAVEIELLGQKPLENKSEAPERLQGLAARAKELSSSVHDLSHQLHPSKLEQLGLVSAVRSLCKELTHARSISIEFTHEDIPQKIAEDLSLCVYRIVQEALANVLKHSGALHAAVHLCCDSGVIQLQVADDGVGFDPQQLNGSPGLGLVNIRERLNLVDGTLVVDSKPNGGTRIEVRVPLRLAPSS